MYSTTEKKGTGAKATTTRGKSIAAQIWDAHVRVGEGQKGAQKAIFAVARLVGMKKDAVIKAGQDWSEWVRENKEEHHLSLQQLDSYARAHSYKGEIEKVVYVSGEYVSSLRGMIRVINSIEGTQTKKPKKKGTGKKGKGKGRTGRGTAKTKILGEVRARIDRVQANRAQVVAVSLSGTLDMAAFDLQKGPVVLISMEDWIDTQMERMADMPLSEEEERSFEK